MREPDLRFTLQDLDVLERVSRLGRRCALEASELGHLPELRAVTEDGGGMSEERRRRG